MEKRNLVKTKKLLKRVIKFINSKIGFEHMLISVRSHLDGIYYIDIIEEFGMGPVFLLRFLEEFYTYVFCVSTEPLGDTIDDITGEFSFRSTGVKLELIAK